MARKPFFLLYSLSFDKQDYRIAPEGPWMEFKSEKNKARDHCGCAPSLACVLSLLVGCLETFIDNGRFTAAMRKAVSCCLLFFLHLCWRDQLHSWARSLSFSLSPLISPQISLSLCPFSLETETKYEKFNKTLHFRVSDNKKKTFFLINHWCF